MPAKANIVGLLLKFLPLVIGPKRNRYNSLSFCFP